MTHPIERAQPITATGVRVSVLFEVKNKTNKLLGRVEVSCGVMNDEKALIGVDEQGVENVSPSEPAYARMLVPIVKPFTPKDAVSATCRIVTAH